MSKRQIVKKHLSFWEDHVNNEDFYRWCGDDDTQFKIDVRKFVRTRNFQSVLDCGAGSFPMRAAFLRDNPDIKYTATEITPKYVKYGLKQGIDVHHCSLEEMPFQSETYDCCVCLDVLNHQLEYEKSIKEMLRIAKKSVIISFFKSFEEDINCYEYKHFNEIVPGEKFTKRLLDQFKHTDLHKQYSKNIAEIFDFARTRYLQHISPVPGSSVDPGEKIEKTRIGTLQHKIIKDDETVCVYHFFNFEKLQGFLSTLDLSDWAYRRSACGTVLLYIDK